LSRTVPLPAFLLPYLARQCDGKSRDDLLWSSNGRAYLRRPRPTSGWFAKAVFLSGVPRTTPHDLRHTAASLAVSAGAHVKAVQKMLGHASAAMTLDIYADLFDDDLEAVATALDQARSRESVGNMWARSGRQPPSTPSDGALTPLTAADHTATEQGIQKFQSSSSVFTALPIT
jgi:Phage integrase family